MKRIAFAILLSLSTLLSGCLFPEKFTAKVSINADGSYSTVFNGTVAHVPALMQAAATKRPLNDKETAEMQSEAAKLAKEPNVKQANYVGNGRFNMTIEGKHKAGARTNLMDIIKVSTDKAGVITIGSTQLKDKDKAQLRELGLTVSGTLDVVLPRNAEIISSNTTSSPSLFGLLGTYSWKIGSIDDVPMMKIRLAK